MLLSKYVRLPMVLLLSLAGTVSGLQAQDEVQLTPELRKEIITLVGSFKRARSMPEKRDEVVDRLLEIGGPATEALLEAINKELGGKLADYGQNFQRAAVAAFRDNVKDININEVRSLQQQVLALKERGNLTKEMIVSEGDPALEKLRSILLVPRAVVLNSSPQLVMQREDLVKIGTYWERCTAKLIEAAPDPPDGEHEAQTFEEYLQGEEELAAQMAMPMDRATRAVLGTNARLASRIDREEARAILACNLTRTLLGLQPLSIDLRLCAAGRDHSEDMERLKFFDHESPVAGKKRFSDRAQNFGTTASGENIFMGVADGARANSGWFHSPGHHKNMLSSHRRIGVGRSGVYFTQMFGR